MDDNGPPDLDKGWREHDRKVIKHLDEMRQHAPVNDDHKRALYYKVQELKDNLTKK